MKHRVKDSLISRSLYRIGKAVTSIDATEARNISHEFEMQATTGFSVSRIAYGKFAAGLLPGALAVRFLDGETYGDEPSPHYEILIATLVFRPQGILGEQTPEGA